MIKYHENLTTCAYNTTQYSCELTLISDCHFVEYWAEPQTG